MVRKICNLILTFCLVLSCFFVFTACKKGAESPVVVYYRVIYDYNIEIPADSDFDISSIFDNYKEEETITGGNTISNLPSLKSDVDAEFEGWFVKNTETKISDGDNISVDVVLVARWLRYPTINPSDPGDEPGDEPGGDEPGGDEPVSDQLVCGFVPGYYEYNEETEEYDLAMTWNDIIQAYKNNIGSWNFSNDEFFSVDASFHTGFDFTGGRIVIAEGIKKSGINILYTGVKEIIFPSSLMEFTNQRNGGNFENRIEKITIAEGNEYFDICENNALITTDDKILVLGCSNTVITDDILKIGECAFKGCVLLENIVFSENITEIGDEAFYGCKLLSSVSLPATIESIGNNVFTGCDSLASINVAEENEVYDSRGDCNAVVVTETNQIIIGCKNTIIPEGINEIGMNTFSGCLDIEEIVIPASVNVIGKYAFYGCKNLISINIPEGVTIIEEGVFNGCESLESIVIPSSVTTIGYSAFMGCSSLENVIIPEGVIQIDGNAFWGCNSFTTITIPKTVQKISGYAFYSCKNLESIIIEDDSELVSIGEDAFWSCSSFESVVFEEGFEIGWTARYYSNTTFSDIDFEDLNDSPLSSIFAKYLKEYYNHYEWKREIAGQEPEEEEIQEEEPIQVEEEEQQAGED